MDKDGSGSISWDECAVGLALLVNGTLEQKMDFAFGFYDADKSGDISQAELTSMIVAALQCSPAEAAGIAGQMFAAYDEDRNGELTVLRWRFRVIDSGRFGQLPPPVLSTHVLQACLISTSSRGPSAPRRGWHRRSGRRLRASSVAGAQGVFWNFKTAPSKSSINLVARISPNSAD